MPDAIVRQEYIHSCYNILKLRSEDELKIRVDSVLRDKKEKELVRKSNGDYTPYSYANELKDSTNPAYRLDMNEVNAMNKEELNVLYYVVRYGEEVLFEVEEGVYQTVAQFVITSLSDLEEEGQSIFRNPLHQKMLDESRSFDAQNSVNSSRYFTNHIDPQISAIAADLMTDKYVLSRMHTKHEEFVGDPKANPREYEEYLRQREVERKEMLVREIFTVVHEYKAAIICDKEREVDQQIREAQEANKTMEMIELIKKKQAILKAKKELSQVIGGRVVLGRR
jgi:DNA primase